MKKLFVLLIAIIMVLTAFSPFCLVATAADKVIYPETKAQMEETVLALVGDALKNRTNEDLSGKYPKTSYTVTINFSNYKDEPFYIRNNTLIGTSYVITLEIFTLLKNNHKYDYEILSLKGGDNEGISTFEMSYTASGVGEKVTELTVTYSFVWGESKQESKTVEDYCLEKVGEIISNGMTDYQKIKAIYSFMAKEFSYATEELENNEPDIYYASYMVKNKKGVCQAYSALFLKLMEAAGLKDSVRAVRHDSYSKGVGHAWNLVKLDGSWYHVDITWDDIGKTAADSYFLKSDAVFKKDHSWRDNFYPAATKNYNPNEAQSSTPPVISTPTGSTPPSSTPTESKPTESKPTESKPTESKPTESKPTESNPTESKPTENSKPDSKPAPSKPSSSSPPVSSVESSFLPTESGNENSSLVQGSNGDIDQIIIVCGALAAGVWILAIAVLTVTFIIKKKKK